MFEVRYQQLSGNLFPEETQAPSRAKRTPVPVKEEIEDDTRVDEESPDKKEIRALKRTAEVLENTYDSLYGKLTAVLMTDLSPKEKVEDIEKIMKQKSKWVKTK